MLRICRKVGVVVGAEVVGRDLECIEAELSVQNFDAECMPVLLQRLDREEDLAEIAVADLVLFGIERIVEPRRHCAYSVCPSR